MHKNPKIISEVIHDSLVVAKIFAPNKGFMKPQDNGEKTFGKDATNKDTKTPCNKDQCTKKQKQKEG